MIPSHWYIYILANRTRTRLQPGICSDLNEFFDSIEVTRRLAPRFAEPCPDRLVYIDPIVSYAEAECQLNKILSYTTMQKERLIRYANPNWADLRLILVQGIFFEKRRLVIKVRKPQAA